MVRFYCDLGASEAKPRLGCFGSSASKKGYMTLRVDYTAQIASLGLLISHFIVCEYIMNIRAIISRLLLEYHGS